MVISIAAFVKRSWVQWAAWALMYVVFTVILTVTTNIWFWKTVKSLFWSGIHAVLRKLCFHVKCKVFAFDWWATFFFLFFFLCVNLVALEISSKSKWENETQKLKWNKTRIFNWRPSNSSTVVFQNTLIILFQFILFLFIYQYCTKFAKYTKC